MWEHPRGGSTQTGRWKIVAETRMALSLAAEKGRSRQRETILRKWCQQDTDIDWIRGKVRVRIQNVSRGSAMKTGWPFSFHILVSVDTHLVKMAHQVILGWQQAVCMKFSCKGHEPWMLRGPLEPTHAVPKCFPSEELPEQVTQDSAKTKTLGKLSEMLRVIAAGTRKWAESTTTGMGCSGSRVGSLLPGLFLASFLGNSRRQQGNGLRRQTRLRSQVSALSARYPWALPGFHLLLPLWEKPHLPGEDSGQGHRYSTSALAWEVEGAPQTRAGTTWPSSSLAAAPWTPAPRKGRQVRRDLPTLRPLPSQRRKQDQAPEEPGRLVRGSPHGEAKGTPRAGRGRHAPSKASATLNN